MRITYNTEADALYIKFQDGKFVKNKEVQEGVILDMERMRCCWGLSF